MMSSGSLHVLGDLAGHLASRPDDAFCHLRKRGDWTTITWLDLASRSASFAQGYLQRGVEPGGIVLVVLEHGVDLFPAFLGAMLIGAVPAFLPFPSSKQDTGRFWRAHVPLFERTQPKVILTWPENAAALSAQLAEPSTCATPREFDSEGDFEALYRKATIDREAIAFLQHSSGTTGIKKGVAISHRALHEHLLALRRMARLDADDRIATWLPVYHDMGLVACFLLPVHAGVPIVALDPFEWVARPFIILDAIQRFRCTHTWWPNFAFHHVSRTHDGEQWDLGCMKAYWNTSEPCKTSAFEHFLATFRGCGVRSEQLQISYGMAEMVFLATATELGHRVSSCKLDFANLYEHGIAVEAPPESSGIEILSCGRPVDGVEYEIVDEKGTVLPDGRVGEVVAWGRCLFAGYFKNEEETNRKLRNGRYFTGDLAFRHNGELYVIGRKDDRIIVCGKNFFAHDIEYVAGKVPGVKGGRIVAFGIYSDEIGSEEVVVVAESAAPEDEWAGVANEIRRAVIGELNLSPRDVRIVAPGWIVKTTSGKMSRHGNAQKYAGELTLESREGAP